MKAFLVLWLATGCLFVECGLLQNTSSPPFTISPSALTYPRQVKRGTAVILEVGYPNGGYFNFNVITANVKRKGDTCKISVMGTLCNECFPPPGMQVMDVNLGPIDSQAIYNVVLEGGTAPVLVAKCTTDVYDSVPSPTTYQYDVLTTNPFNPAFNADTLSLTLLTAYADSSIAIPLIRVADNHWRAAFTNMMDTLGLAVYPSPLDAPFSEGFQKEQFRLTNADRFRICYIIS